jgi:hypothetical protein
MSKRGEKLPLSAALVRVDGWARGARELEIYEYEGEQLRARNNFATCGEAPIPGVARILAARAMPFYKLPWLCRYVSALHN